MSGVEALLDEQPLQVVTQAVALSTQGTQEEVSDQVNAMQECFQEETPNVQRDVAEYLLSLLTPEQVHDLVSWLSPQPFYTVGSIHIVCYPSFGCCDIPHY